MDIQRAIDVMKKWSKSCKNHNTHIFELEDLELNQKTKEILETAISAMRELQQYRQIGTVDECTRYKIHSQNISKLHSCNDCRRRYSCGIALQLGDYCRINCYLWEGKRNKTDGCR